MFLCPGVVWRYDPTNPLVHSNCHKFEIAGYDLRIERLVRRVHPLPVHTYFWFTPSLPINTHFNDLFPRQEL